MTLRITLMIGLLGTACSERLPQAPEGCEGVQCGCQEHTDCPLETPECLAGVCRESQDSAIVWAHRDQVLPAQVEEPLTDLHAVELDRLIDQSKASLLDGLLEESPAPDWLMYRYQDGSRVALHSSGLLMVRPTASTPRIWDPQPEQLANTGPGIHPDLRALAGYGVLKRFIKAAITAGLISARNPARLLNSSEHRVVLGQPLHLLIGDLVGPIDGRQTTFKIPNLSKLIERGFALPHSNTRSSVNYPSDNADSLVIGRSYRFSLTSPGTLRVVGKLYESTGDCRPELVITINDQPAQRWSDWSVPFTEELNAGEHALEFKYLADCEGAQGRVRTHWARLSIVSDQTISLHRWESVMPLPFDNNARPVLYNESGGWLRDQDGDHWPDKSDLCPNDADNQLDGDQNGIGDACDGIVSARAERGRIVALDRNGTQTGEFADEAIRASSPLTVTPLPQTGVSFVGSNQTNPYATTGAALFQAAAGESVYEWHTGTPPTPINDLIPEALNDFNPSLELKQVRADHRHTTLQLAAHLRAGETSVTLQMLAMRTTTPTMTEPTDRQQFIRYLYSGSEPAFVVANPNEPLLLISDQNARKTTFSAMRVQATSLARFPIVVFLPARDRCADDNDCPALVEAGHEITRTCRNSYCTSDSTSGRCVRINAPESSSFLPCTPRERTGLCSRTGRCDRGNCAGFQCWAAAHPECDAAESCLPRSQTADDFGETRFLPPSLQTSLSRGLMSPLAMSVTPAFTEAVQEKYLGVVQALPMMRGDTSDVALTACPREWMDGRRDAFLSPDEQRALLRNVFNVNVAAQDIFEIAEVDPNWLLPYFDDPPSSVCRPLRSKWRGYFPLELAPSTAELVDIDNDGVREFRVGFSMLENSEDSEPAVYRCFDFNGDHQANNCTP